MVISILREQSIFFVVSSLCSSVQGAQQQVPCVRGTKQISVVRAERKIRFLPLLPQSC